MEAKFCQQERSNISIENEQIKAAFVTLYIICGACGITFNMFVIYVIQVTNQLQNQSIKLLMFLSIADLFSSLATFVRLVLIYVADKVNCQVLGWTYFLYLVSIYCTSYLFALTGFDRFLRVKYLEEYATKFTNARFFILMICYLLLVFVQAGIGAYLNSQNHIGYAGSYTMPVSFVVICLVILFYIMSIIKLRRYQRMNQSLYDATKAALQITMVYLYLFIFLTVSSLVYQVFIRQIELSKDQHLVLQNVIGLLPTILGSINAVTFVVINPLANAYAMTIIRSLVICPQSSVGVSTPNDNA